MSRWLARHAAYPVLGVSAIVWVWMIGDALTSSSMACCPTEPSLREDALAWVAMVVAMMVPTTVAQMRDVAARSYRVRRMRSVIAYTLGYLAWWLVLGAAVCMVPRSVMPSAVVFALVGAAWMLVPTRELWHARCHRRLPLHPVTWRAEVSAFRQGTAHGAPCVSLCWPLMIACTLTGHSLFVMIGCTWLVFFEKRMRLLRRAPLVVGALAIAVIAWIV